MVGTLKKMWKTWKKPIRLVTHLGDRPSLQGCAAMACRSTMVGGSMGNGDGGRFCVFVWQVSEGYKNGPKVLMFFW